jgi:hypothetical protein
MARAGHPASTTRSAPEGGSTDVRHHERSERELELVENVAHWMDRRYLDPLLALVLPGIGDVLGAVIGLASVVVAVRMRAHPALIARMLIHLAVDALLGSIPFLGPVVDIFYRANSRNLELLRQRDVWRASSSDWLVVGGAGLAFLAALILPVLALVAFVRWAAG